MVGRVLALYGSLCDEVAANSGRINRIFVAYTRVDEVSTCHETSDTKFAILTVLRQANIHFISTRIPYGPFSAKMYLLADAMFVLKSELKVLF